MHHVNVKEPAFSRTYIAPGEGTDDHALVIPSFVLAQIFGGGETSRLYQSLVVQQKIASSVDADYNGISVGPGEFHISAVPAQGVTLPALEAAIDKEVAQIMTRGINPGELTRAKTLLKADTIYARDGNEGAARTLGSLLMAGFAPDYFASWPDKVDAVTTQDLQKAAKAIFNADASVTGYLLPEEGAQ